MNLEIVSQWINNNQYYSHALNLLDVEVFVQFVDYVQVQENSTECDSRNENYLQLWYVGLPTAQLNKPIVLVKLNFMFLFLIFISVSVWCVLSHQFVSSLGELLQCFKNLCCPQIAKANWDS